MTTHIINIVDASGSMDPRADETRITYNKYLNDLKADVEQDYSITTVVFSSRNFFNYINQATPLADAAALDEDNYRTMGFTALYDAVGTAINDFFSRPGGPNVPEGDHVLVSITTDGKENDSIDFTKESLAALVKVCESKGWQFLYVAQGFDGWDEASRSGFSANSYVGTRAVGPEVTRSTGHTMTRFSQAGARGQTVNAAGYMVEVLPEDQLHRP